MPLGDWANNAIMTWDGNKITDHGRQPLGLDTERVGTDKRMADGTLRRQHIGVKRTWHVQWESIPSKQGVSGGVTTVDGGYSGEQIEAFYYATPGKFRMVLRRGSAIGKSTPNPAESALPYVDSDFYVVNVMLTDFSKEVHKRGTVDLWNLSVTLEEI